MLSRCLGALLICSLPTSALAQSQGPLKILDSIAVAHDALPNSGKATAAKGGRDSVKDGAIIGAVVLGTWCAIICGQGLDHAGQLPLAVAANAGLGALIGAQIDASHYRRPGIYFRKRW